MYLARYSPCDVSDGVYIALALWYCGASPCNMSSGHQRLCDPANEFARSAVMGTGRGVNSIYREGERRLFISVHELRYWIYVNLSRTLPLRVGIKEHSFFVESPRET